jgi:ubiquitin C-terminal hydrolase
MGFGHYTAFARDAWEQDDDDAAWYSFDDSQVTRVLPSKVKSNAAYILFYKRQMPSTPSKL